MGGERVKYSIEMKGLTRYYNGFPALEDFNLKIGENDDVALLGPNGAGKTTIMKILCGLITPSSGTAKVLGFDVVAEREKALLNIGAMIETPEFYPYLKPTEILSYLGRLRGMDPKTIDESKSAILSIVGLERWSEVKVGKFSRGMKQRLALAQALLHDPKVLILDEPSLGLDPRGMKEFRDIIRKYRKRKTVFLSSHLIGEAVQMCTKIAIIDQGRLKAFDTVSGLIKKYRSVERAYLKLTEVSA
ncbi:MAG: ABC transporter ATP-binding protein [Candidatus Hadarchaeales archaeon]